MGVLAFASELLALWILAHWGWQANGLVSVLAGVLAAIAAPAAFIVIWGTWLAPKAPFRLTHTPRQAVKLLLFALVGFAAARLYGVWPAALLTFATLFIVFLGEAV